MLQRVTKKLDFQKKMVFQKLDLRKLLFQKLDVAMGDEKIGFAKTSVVCRN